MNGPLITPADLRPFWTTDQVSDDMLAIIATDACAEASAVAGLDELDADRFARAKAAVRGELRATAPAAGLVSESRTDGPFARSKTFTARTSNDLLSEACLTKLRGIVAGQPAPKFRVFEIRL